MTSPNRQSVREYAEPHTYIERLGVGVDEVLERLAQPPEHELTAEEREAFFAIDGGLLQGRYDRDLGEGVDGTSGEVEGWYREPPAPVNFVLDYFTTEDGTAALAEFEEEYGVQPGPSAEHPGVQQAQRLAMLGRLAGEDKDMEAGLKKLAKRSQKYTVDRVAHALEHDEDLEDSPHVYVFTRPQRTINQVRQVQRMRTFLRGVRQDVRHRDDLPVNVRRALLVSVDGLRQKATAQLGSLYPNVINLYHQALLMRDADPEYAAELGEQLTELSGPMHRVLETAESDNDVEERFIFTMDRWRNGVVEGPEDTSFSAELLALEQNLDAGIEEEASESLEAAFTPEEIEYLDSLEFDAEAMADMARHWLNSNNLLSEDTYGMFEKGRWPSDSRQGQPRIGVVVGQFDNLAYSRGWVLIPQDSPNGSSLRRLRQQTPSGPALVIPHELQHAIDGITAEYGERQVSVATAAARNSGGVREGVGKDEEDKASRHLFGEPLHQSTVYIKALRAWGETGSESAAIVAYARQTAREQGLEQPTRGQIATAQNRVQRLIKAGVQAASGWNSQPLVYAEQVLVAEALQPVSRQVRETVAANSYLDLPLMARFHEFGLLATERFQPTVTPIQSMEDYLRGILAQRNNA
jgi:hypothetical protein